MKSSPYKSRRTESKAKVCLSAWRKAYKKWGKRADRRLAEQQIHESLGM